MTACCSREMTLWQRYRGSALIAVAGLLTVGVATLAFPGIDLSRGSPDRYWLLGAMVAVGLVVIGADRLLRGRRDSSSDDDPSARTRPGQRSNRRNVFNLALIGLVLVGAGVWVVATDRGAGAAALSVGLGVASLLAAVGLHRWLLRRGEV